MIRKFRDGKIKVAHEHDTGIAFRVAWKGFACLAIVNCELKECGVNAVKARLRHMPVPNRNTAQVLLLLCPVHNKHFPEHTGMTAPMTCPTLLKSREQHFKTNMVMTNSGTGTSSTPSHTSITLYMITLMIFSRLHVVLRETGALIIHTYIRVHPSLYKVMLNHCREHFLGVVLYGKGGA
jgi:hypothetical protein